MLTTPSTVRAELARAISAGELDRPGVSRADLQFDADTFVDLALQAYENGSGLTPELEVLGAMFMPVLCNRTPPGVAEERSEDEA